MHHARRRSLTAAALAAALALGGLAGGALPASAAGSVPALGIDGNRIVDASGSTFTMRGVSVLPPEQNDVCTTCNAKPISETIDIAAEWGANIVRLPVTEVYGTTDLAAYDAEYIEPYVDQAVELGLYLIIDLHYVRDYGVPGGVPQADVERFWDYIAPKYGDVSNVVFEVFNEPLAPVNWTSWKTYIQPVVDSIREAAPDTVLLMGSPSWSTMVNQAAADPIEDHATAYVYHLYPNQGAPTESFLDGRFGAAAETIPVVLSEFGWNPPGPYADSITSGTTTGFGVPLRAYLDGHPHIGWQAWVLDNFWKPQMFDEQWNLLGGEHQGQFVKDWLGGLPNVSPCEDHDAVGATATASSSLSGAYPASNLVDGDCSTAGRWISAADDATPTATVELAMPTDVSALGVYSGYNGALALVDFTVEVRVGSTWSIVADVVGNDDSALEVPVGVDAVEAIRLTVTDPSDSTTEAELARVAELAVRG